MNTTYAKLIASAQAAQQSAYCPYSKFKVGAAVLTSEGLVFTAANVENASYGLSQCAERNALAQAVAAGHADIQAVAVVTDGDGGGAPCGACRQVISEFGGDIDVIYRGRNGAYVVAKIRELLPDAFVLPHQD